MFVSRADLAHIFGVAKTTVDGWLRDGCPCDGGGGRGVERRLNPRDVHHWLLDRARNEPDLKAPRTPEGEISLHEALRRKEVANAKSAEIGLAEAMAAVAPIDTMKEVIRQELAATESRLRSIPTKLRPTAQSCATTQAKAERVAVACGALIDEALSEIKVSRSG